jgi:DNA-binding XRE family transcriptional regulator
MPRTVLRNKGTTKLGRFLLLYRKIAGISQEELAKKIGTSRAVIAMCEIGRSDANIKSAYKISQYFEISLDEFYHRFIE